ncbi:MAG: alpha/beta fold hydrolase [Tuberibacillus sp.]
MAEAYSIFKTLEGKETFTETYDQCLHKLWNIPFESIYINTRFGRTHVLICGNPDGAPLVLLHGMTMNSIMWYENIPVFSQKFKIYCIDTLGDYGKSEVTVPLKTRDDCSDWLSEVLDGLNLDQIILAGHSMGGWLSLNFALAFPERVEKLMLLAPIMSVIRLPLKFMLKVYPVILRPKREKILKLWSWFLAKGNQLDENINEIIVQGWLHCRPQLRVIPRVFKDSELAGLKSRTLFLVGENEVVYPAHKAVNRVKRLIPGAKTGIIPHSNHCFIAEQKDLVNQKMMDFLESE